MNRDQNARSAVGREHLTLVALTLNPSPTPLVPPYRGMAAEASPFCLTERDFNLTPLLPRLGEGAGG
jgi:hypothetical protein